MSQSQRLPAFRCSPKSSRRRLAGTATIVGLAAIVAALAACASTPGDRALGQVQSGVAAAGRDAWEEAEFRWLKALAIDAGDARALNNLAVLAERRGERDEAAGRYRDALARATPEERTYVRENYDKYAAVADESSASGDGPSPDAGASAVETSSDAPSGAAGGSPSPPVRTREITVSVDAPGGLGLSQFERILIGNFVIESTPSGTSPAQVNHVAVRFFRRRLVQRTFFQTVDLLDEPLPSRDPEVLKQSDVWVERAARVGADLVFTGSISLGRSDSSRVVREQIRSPVTGELEEVARFRQMTSYALTLDYEILRAANGDVLLDGGLNAAREFPVDQGPPESDAIAETFESLLPQVLEVITPRRAEQTRVLLY